MKKNLSKANKNNNNIISIPFKSFSENECNQKIIKFNGFNIIELNEDENNNNSINEISLNEFENDLEMIPQKEIRRLMNISNKIENYFEKKGLNNIEDGTCFKCRIKYSNSKDLLYFLNRKELLSYLKYCFCFLKKIVFINHQNYVNNKYDLEKCNSNYLINWKFFIPKVMCRICFMEVINMNNLFGNLKTIFSDIDKIDLDRHKNRGFVSNFRRNHRRKKKRILSLKINDSKKSKNNKPINENIIISNNKNRIIIKKSILNRLDLSFLNKKTNQKFIENKINVLGNPQNINITQTFNTFNIINNYNQNKFYGYSNNNSEKEQNSLLNEGVPKFFSNKIVISLYELMYKFFLEIKSINNNIYNFKCYESNPNVFMNIENFKKFKNYFKKSFMELDKSQSYIENLFTIIAKKIKEMSDYINKLLMQTNKEEVQTRLTNLINHLVLIENDRVTLYNKYQLFVNILRDGSQKFLRILDDKEYFINSLYNILPLNFEKL